ncbi:hypothetical protein TWF696_008535 [Orbilia brochopaga]|uniref:F-box domain-containing protein n=1 Tax=Orbilia brochopaga TaxID=3140254 RepID=A0AAV9UH84_9PEZI
MNTLPTELLGDIVNQDILTTPDVLNIARVSRLFGQLAAARLYRSGELSYIGATEREARKVEAFSKYGKHVRTLTLNLCPHRSSPLTLIPTELPRLLRPLTNLHAFTLLDAASLPWPDFAALLAGLITTHFALKHLELQATLLPSDGTQDITRARSILASSQTSICKLDSFTLRISARHAAINRTAIDHLIEILQPATRSAKSFQYSCDCFDSPPRPSPATTASKRAVTATTHRSWEWDTLETLSLKLPTSWNRIRSEAAVQPHTQTALTRDLHNVTTLAIKLGTADLLTQLNNSFEYGLASLPALQHLRISQSGGYRLDWDPDVSTTSNSQPDHPFYAIARTLPSLLTIDQTDPYYMTRIIQSWRIIRSPEDPDAISFKMQPY